MLFLGGWTSLITHFLKCPEILPMKGSPAIFKQCSQEVNGPATPVHATPAYDLYFTWKWGPGRWICAPDVRCRQTGETPFISGPKLEGMRNLRAAFTWSRCHTRQRPVISRVSSLPEESRCLRWAHCNVSSPERTIRATVTAGSSLSPEGPEGTLLLDVTGEGRLPPEGSVGRGPSGAWPSLQLRGLEEGPEGPGRAEIPTGQLHVVAGEGSTRPCGGCWN